MFTFKVHHIKVVGTAVVLASTSGCRQQLDAPANPGVGDAGNTPPATIASAGDFHKRLSGERLNSVLWVGTSVEYGATALQAYKLAQLQLDVALRDRSWTAATEQQDKGRFAKMPPAIILDIDETALDNTPYNARMVQENKDYNEDDWMKWIASPAARSVPGAVSFTQYAHRKGVAIFYISNRGLREKDDTVRALQRLGFPLRSRQSVLLKSEKPQWTSDKTSRRRFVAQTHRVLLLLGDDFNDFAPAAKASPEKRLQLKAKYQAFWGSKWIMLANPVYGSWEKSLSGDDKASKEEKTRRKHQVLQTLSSYQP